MKTTLVVGRKVTKGGFVNLYTPFCSFKSAKRQYLNFNDKRIEQHLSFNYPRDFLKYQFDAWQDAVSISWAGKLLFRLGWEAPRDGSSVRIMGPITIPGWHQEGHLVIKFSHN